MLDGMILASTSAAVHSYDVPWFMYAAVVVALIGYALIEAWHMRTDHVVKMKEAIHWSVFYISIALLFTIPVFVFISHQAAAEYLAAWAIEKSLSLDNLFVIGLIFAAFKVPVKLERRMLNYGIAGAIFFRLVFIMAGYELLKRFEWVGIIFGIILLRAAWHTFKEARGGHEGTAKDITHSKTWRLMTRLLPIHHGYDGHKLTTRINDKKMLTMMAAVIIMIELTDIVFAVDSVPAVLAVSPDRFIAYSSNVFALLGLRALFFVYQGVEEKFWALNWALAAILTWIGIKMVGIPLGLHLSVGVSLAVLGVLFSGGIIVSLLFPHHKKS